MDPLEKVLYMQPFSSKKSTLLKFLYSYWVSVGWKDPVNLCYSGKQSSSLKLWPFWLIRIVPSWYQTSQWPKHFHSISVIASSHQLPPSTFFFVLFQKSALSNSQYLSKFLHSKFFLNLILKSNTYKSPISSLNNLCRPWRQHTLTLIAGWRERVSLSLQKQQDMEGWNNFNKWRALT